MGSVTARWTRLALAGAVAAVGLTVVPTFAAPTTSCSRPATGWFRLTPPPFFNQPVAPDAPVPGAQRLSNDIRAWTVLPGSGRVVLASDGAEIARSADGGCTWSSVFSVTGAFSGAAADPYGPSTSLPYYVTGLVTSPRFAQAQKVFAVLTPGAALDLGTLAASEPPALVAVSSDGGMSWRVTPPAPPTGSDVPHCAALQWSGVSVDGSQLTVVCAPGIADEEVDNQTWDTNYDLMFRTSDAGATWTKLHLPPSWWSAQQSLAIDAHTPLGYWGLGSVATGRATQIVVYHSADGMKWNAVSTMIPDYKPTGYSAFGLTDRADPPGSGRQLLFWSSVDGVMQSSDGGRHWRQSMPAPNAVAYLRGLAAPMSGASYLPGGDILLIGQMSTTEGCDKGGVELTRLRHPRWARSAMPSAPASWDGGLATILAFQSTSGGPSTTVYALATTKKDCATGFLTSYVGS